MTIVGHIAQQSEFVTGWRSGRVHHAWLLAGPRGIGKSAFADAAARFVLSGGNGESLGEASASATALQAAGSHPDFRRLERTENDRGVLRAEIVVEQIRDLQALLNSTPSLGDWRVVIVDAVDELNRNAANSFLKNLEEPPAKTVFFLVSHNPGRLLPTIRSRCRTLRFQPLDKIETKSVLQASLPDAEDEEIAVLVGLAEGSPGRALRFAGLGVQKMTERLRDIVEAPSPTGALTLARSLSGKTAQARYEAFVELVPAFIAGEARQRSGASLAHAIQLWEKAHALAAEAVPLAYDPQAVAFELAGLVGELGRH